MAFKVMRGEEKIAQQENADARLHKGLLDFRMKFIADVDVFFIEPEDLFYGGYSPQPGTNSSRNDLSVRL